MAHSDWSVSWPRPALRRPAYQFGGNEKKKLPRALKFSKMADLACLDGEKVGDSSTNRLANYQRCARELLRSALLEQHGGTLITSHRAPKPTELRRWALIRGSSLAFYIEFALYRRKEELLSKQIEAAVEVELSE